MWTLGVAFSCRSNLDIKKKDSNATNCGSASKKSCSLQISKSEVILTPGESVTLASKLLVAEQSSSLKSNLLTLSGCTTSIITTDSSSADLKITGVSTGSCTLKLAYKTASTTVSVTVGTQIKSLAITPSTGTGTVGSSKTLTATATYVDNTSVDVTKSVQWSSEPLAAVTFSSTTPGIATFNSNGTVSLFATLSGQTAESKWTISGAHPTSLFLVDSDRPNYLGVSKRIQVIAVYADGSTQDVSSSATWTSSNTSRIVVNDSTDKGVMQSVGGGAATITAEYDGLSANLDLNVSSATISSVAIVPPNGALANGFSSALKATATYSDGMVLDISDSATWSTSNSATASVSNTTNSVGHLTGAGLGTATITANVLGVTGTSTINVNSATLSSIAVTPSSITKPAGTTTKMYAQGTFSDGSIMDLTPFVTWSTNNSNGTVSNSNPTKGLVTSTTAGAVTLSATLGATSNTSALTVSSATLVSIAITPSSLNVTANEKVKFTAIGTYSDASTHDITDMVNWNVSNATVAQISNSGETKGILLAKANGSITVGATLSGVSSSSATTVAPSAVVLSSIIVTPAMGVTTGTSTLQFKATGLYSNGSLADITASSTWLSSVGAVATVNGATGLATGVSSGLTTLTATKDSKVGQAQLRVTNDQAAPAQPTGLVGVADSMFAITFSWASGGGTTASYKYAYQSGGAAPANCNSGATGTTISNSVTISAAMSGLEYSMIVCAMNSDLTPELGVASAPASMNSKPSVPSAFAATTASTTSIDLTWSDMFGDTGGYKIAYQSGATAPANCDAGTTQTAVANATSATISGLAASTQYSFIICTVNSASGQSAASSAISATTDTSPATPTSFTATASTSLYTTIDLSWNDMTGDAGGYKIAYQSGASAPANCNAGTTTTAAANATSKSITGLSGATQYSFIICTVNGTSTQSAASSSASATTIPLTPTGFAAVANATTPTTQIDLSWADMAGDTGGYKIAFRSGASAPADCDSDTTSTAAANATSQTVTGLSIATQYTFIICTVNSVSGKSAPASSISVFTKPSVPTNLSAGATSTVAITLTWDNMAQDTNGYKIAYKSGGVAPVSCSSDSTTTAAADATSRSITGLAAGTQYTFIICQSNTSAGDSVASAGVSTYTMPAAPSISATVDSSSQITISWSAITGDTGGYKIAYKSGAVAPVDCNSDSTTTAASGATSRAISGLTASTQYTFVACTVNSVSGQSATSSSATGTTSGGSSSQTLVSGTLGTSLNVNSVNTFTSLSNLSTSNNVYAQWDQAGWGQSDGAGFSATNFGFSIPGGATIDGIEVIIEHVSENLANVNVLTWAYMQYSGAIVGSNKGSGLTTSPYISTTETTLTLGGATDLWGDTWTPAKVNSSSFGVDLTYYFNSYIASAPLKIDHLQVKVYYH
ncbi:MAG: fibronectin type III domain-containing protein [Proteobacteria bacterium]|nr:fibronectin type III domain-containing protein [Pseudomonadota bacterium]